MLTDQIVRHSVVSLQNESHYHDGTRSCKILKSDVVSKSVGPTTIDEN